MIVLLQKTGKSCVGFVLETYSSIKAIYLDLFSDYV